MMIGLSISFCIVFATVLYAFYKVKLNSYELEHEKLILQLDVRSKEIVIKYNELNKRTKWLDDMVVEAVHQRAMNLSIYRQLEEKNTEVHAIHADNVMLCEINKAALKENKLQLHNIRRASMFAYQQYKSMSEMLRSMLLFDDGESPLFSHIRNAINVVHGSMHNTSNYFKMYFKMTPEEYLNQKVALTGKRSNDTDFVSDFSMN